LCNIRESGVRNGLALGEINLYFGPHVGVSSTKEREDAREYLEMILKCDLICIKAALERSCYGLVWCGKSSLSKPKR